MNNTNKIQGRTYHALAWVLFRFLPQNSVGNGDRETQKRYAGVHGHHKVNRSTGAYMYMYTVCSTAPLIYIE